MNLVALIGIQLVGLLTEMQSPNFCKNGVGFIVKVSLLFYLKLL